jgi:acetoacetyl-CoA synthetase
MWTHGDLIEFAADGSARIHGRSDGVVNVNGVRIGPSEIYTVVRRIPQVAEVMAVEQRDPAHPGLSRLVLLVVLRPDRAGDDDLTRLIRSTLRREASPAHVPSLVLYVDALPVTHNGKPSERSARDVLNGDPVANVAALRNPQALTAIAAAARAVVAAPDADATEGDVAVEGEDVHTAVARAFSDMLGAHVDETTNFFDAGGTSRQSIRLVRRLRLQLGVDVPMEGFLADPSIRGLTAALAAVTGERPAVELLAPGNEAEPPLFLVHGAFGDLDDYQHLVELLTVSAPVYGLRGRLAAPDGSFHSLRELASGHAETLTAFQPTGPLRLAGHSFGGLLAFEIARQLTARGRTVSFLGLMDVRPPTAGLTVRQRLVKRAGGLLAATFRVEERTLAGVVLDRVRPQRATAYSESPHGRARTVYNAYRWEPYEGPVTFFRATRRVPVLTHQLYAWRRIAPRMTVVDTPGMHFDVVNAGHANMLAERLAEALRNSAG